MREVDVRLDVTAHYRELLRGSLFATETEAGAIVEEEIRRFVRNRIEVLLGIRQETNSNAFTGPEVTALKVWAKHILSEMGPEDNNTIPVPPAPKRTVRAEAPPRVAPSVMARPAPASSPPSAPKLPARPVEAPVVAATPEPQGVKPKGKSGSKGKKLKVTTTVDHFTKEVTELTVPTERPSGALPFPSEHSMSAIMESQAMQAASAGEARMGLPGFVNLATR